jgi:mannose-6-phosphate isomerase-like protein (cupin superfamily)
MLLARTGEHSPNSRRECDVSQEPLAQGGIHQAKGQGKSYWLLTDLHTFKAVGADTNGAFVAAELMAGPALGPPPHIHRNADETFYILEGIFEFSLAGKAFTAQAGSYVYLPKGVVHTHRAGGGAPAKALVMQVPAGVEHFIMEAGKPAPDTSQTPPVPDMSDLQKIVGIAMKHGIEVPM